MVEFEMCGEGHYVVTINPANVESVVPYNYDNVKCTEITLASGAKHHVKGDYPDVLARLRVGR